MARNDTAGRRVLAGGLKSAVASGAVVATIGGWVVFGATDPQNAEGGTVAAPAAAAPAPTAAPQAIQPSPDQGQTMPQLDPGAGWEREGRHRRWLGSDDEGDFFGDDSDDQASADQAAPAQGGETQPALGSGQSVPSAPRPIGRTRSSR